MIVQALQAALFYGAFGVYAPFWMAEFGWSRTTISLIHSLQRTESGLLGPVNGWLISRFGPQRMTIIGLTIMGLSMVGLGFANGFATFLAAFLVMAIGASFCGILSLMTIVVNWFDRRRASAMALVGLGMSIGGLTAPILAWLIVTYGWRGVMVASGIVFLALTYPLGKLLVGEPEAIGLRPDGETATDTDLTTATTEGQSNETSRPKQPGQQAATRSFTMRSMLRSRPFWLLTIGHSNALAIVSAVGVHFIIYAEEIIGLSVTVGATLLMITTIFSMVGQASGGFLGDKLDKRVVAGTGMLLHTAAMVILTLMPNYFGAIAAAILHGLGWGVRGPLMSAMRADYFGRAAFAKVMGLSSLFITVGSVLGPLSVGLLADNNGGYAWGFGLLAAVGLMGAIAFFALEKPPSRETLVASA